MTAAELEALHERATGVAECVREHAQRFGRINETAPSAPLLATIAPYIVALMLVSYIVLNVQYNKSPPKDVTVMMHAARLIGGASVLLLVVSLVVSSGSRAEIAARHTASRLMANTYSLQNGANQMGLALKAAHAHLHGPSSDASGAMTLETALQSARASAIVVSQAYERCNLIIADQPKMPFPISQAVVHSMIAICVLLIIFYAYDAFKPNRAVDLVRDLLGVKAMIRRGDLPMPSDAMKLIKQSVDSRADRRDVALLVVVILFAVFALWVPVNIPRELEADEKVVGMSPDCAV